MVEIKAGRELDLAVAEALGWQARCSDPWERWDAPPEVRTIAVDKSGDVHWIDGGPSTDLNAAFDAAVEVGLFSCTRVLGCDEDAESPTWFVWRGLLEVLSYAPTPALAICAAILKLKEK